MSDPDLFAHWLRERRKALDLTQEAFAERAGLSASAVRKFESGSRKPSRQVAELLAEALRISHDERARFLRMARGASEAEEANPPPSNLPAQLTPLIGRDQELAALSTLLQQDEVRLLTLTGPPGIGKTRLALAVAQNLIATPTLTDHSPPTSNSYLRPSSIVHRPAQFEDGVFLVSLAPVQEPTAMVQTMASTLGLRDTGREPLKLALREHLQGKRLLLLLDNLEQLVSAASLVVDLLERCPGLKVLATSREALYVRGERQFVVPPLEVPSTEYRVPSTDRPQEAQNSVLGTQYSVLSTIPSVALFIERAQEVAPNFNLTPDNAGSIASICRHVEGVPLAIELVAAWVRLLPPHILLQRLQRRPTTSSPILTAQRAPESSVLTHSGSLDMLAGGPRDLPARHRALRDAIGWSYNLLSDGERLLFTRLGIFVGGCALSAAEAVCNAIGDLPFSLVEGLSSLLDKSLLKRDTDERTGGEPRYRMLATIREYAEEQLQQSGEGGHVREWFAQYYLALAQEFKTQLMSRDQRAWVARIEQELDNIRSVLRWALDAGKLEVAAHILLSIYNFWYIRGYVGEGRAWLEEGSNHPGRNVLPDIMQAELLSSAGFLASSQYDLAQAARWLDEALSISRRIGDKEKIALALNALGSMPETQRGHYTQAEALLREAHDLFEVLGQDHRAGIALYNLALIALFTGDAERSQALLMEALPLLRRGGDWNTGLALCALGFALCKLAEYERAEEACAEATASFTALSAGTLGLAIALACRAEIARCQGRVSQSSSFFKESLSVDREASNHRVAAQTLMGLGLLASTQGQAERAATLFGILDGWSERLEAQFVMPADKPDYDSALTSTRQSLSPERWELAWARGRSMTLDQAIDFALDEDSNSTTS